MILINALAIAVYLATSWYALKRFQRHVVLFGYMVFVSFWALMSCFYNDLGIYNLELFRYTEISLATSRLALFSVVFNLGFILMAHLVGGRVLTRTDYRVTLRDLRLGNLRVVTWVGGAVLITYLAYTLYSGGIPLLTGLGRYDYFQQAGPLQRTILTYGPLFAFLCGFYEPREKRVPIGGLLMLAYLVYAVLLGNKFSFLVLLSVVYLVPVLVRRTGRDPGYRLITPKRIILAAAAAIALLVIVFGSYLRSQGDRELAWKYMYNRVLAFQGEMWWAVDNDVRAHGRYDPDHWIVEWNAVIDPQNPDRGEVGLRYLMIKVLGPERAYAIIDRGYLYTGTYPAILIATFPYGIALGVQFLAGIIFFLMLYYLHYTVQYRHIVRAGITILILIPYTVTLISGSLGTVLTLGLLVKVCLLAICELGLVRSRPISEATQG